VADPPDHLLEIFWVEATEYLGTLNQLLLQMEVAPEAERHTHLREVSRIAHSLKGAARTVGLKTIEALAHQMEDVFDLMLAGQVDLTPEICDTLYDGLDLIQGFSDGGEADPDGINQVLERLSGFALAAPPPEGNAAPPPDRTKRQTLIIDPIPQAEPLPPPSLRPGDDTVRVSISKLDEVMGQVSELLVARMHSEQRRRDLQYLLQEHHRWQRRWRKARSAYIRTVRRLRGSVNGSGDMADLLEFLDATQHYMSQSRRDLTALNRALAQDTLYLATLADKLQADIAAVRMLPFDTILGPFQRMVRDLARDSGKEVELVIQGAGVELDKHVLEALKDPLMHLLRNAVDHGIELPATRVAAGKLPKGTITLNVTSRGNDIQVSVGDDGRGIDPDLVRQRALEAGIIGATEAETLSPDEAAALIFVPRFSTASQVTTISGRGVGLDVVQQRIEGLRGRIWLENTPGQGAIFHMVVPVSLTRIHCLLVRIGAEVYAVPLTAVARISALGEDEVFFVDNRPMIRVSNRPTPLIHLADVLERSGPRGALDETTPILVLRSTERAVAFIVDELLNEQELVLKALGAELSRVRNVAGAALLGTGEVVIVLNTSDLIKSARRSGPLEPPNAVARTPIPADERPPLPHILIVDDSLTTRTLEKNILEAAGYHVRTATDGEEALRALIEEPCHIIVTDVEMPNMDGFELTQRVKEDARWRHIPVILVTSRDSSADRERGYRAGADAYLVKTRFDQDELLQMIEQMV